MLVETNVIETSSKICFALSIFFGGSPNEDFVENAIASVTLPAEVNVTAEDSLNQDESNLSVEEQLTAAKKKIELLERTIEENLAKHKEEIAEVEKNACKKIKEARAACATKLNQSQLENEANMAKLYSELNSQRSEYSGQYINSVKTMLEKQVQLVDENVKHYQEHIDVIRESHEKEIESLTKLHQDNTKKMTELHIDRCRQLATIVRESKLTIRAQARQIDELLQSLRPRIELNTTQRVARQFLEMLWTIEETADMLNQVKLKCVVDQPESVENSISLDLENLSGCSRSFKHQAHFFKETTIDERNIDRGVLDLCREYLQKFENLMESDQFLNLCIHLPPSIENKDQEEVLKFQKDAEDLSTEFKNRGKDLEEKLEVVLLKDVNFEEEEKL